MGEDWKSKLERMAAQGQNTVKEIAIEIVEISQGDPSSEKFDPILLAHEERDKY